MSNIENLAIQAQQTEKAKILIVNTCGWVDGLGKEITTNMFENLKPEVMVTMYKSVKTE